MREKELKIELFKQNFLKTLTENDWELYHTYLNLDEIKEVLRKDLNCRFEEIGLIIYPKENINDYNKNILIDTYDDHRMAMSFSLAGLLIDNVKIHDPNCVSKTFPNYFDEFEKIYK